MLCHETILRRGFGASISGWAAAYRIAGHGAQLNKRAPVAVGRLQVLLRARLES